MTTAVNFCPNAQPQIGTTELQNKKPKKAEVSRDPLYKRIQYLEDRSWWTPAMLKERVKNTYYMLNPAYTLDTLQGLLEKRPGHYKKVCALNTINQQMCLIGNKAYVEAILTLQRNPDEEDRLDGGFFLTIFRRAMGETVATCPASKSTIFRKALKPSFIGKVDSVYHEKFEKHSLEQIQTWLKSSSSINLTQGLNEFTLKIIASVFLNFESDLTEINEATKTLTKSLRAYFFGVPFKVYEHSVKWATSVLQRSITDLLKEPQDTIIKDMKEAKTRDGEAIFTEKEIKDGSSSIFLAGGDTTSSTLIYLIYELGKRPELQDAIYQEWAQQRADGKTFKQYVNSEKTLLNAVVQEGLRLNPPAVNVPRRASQTIYINDHEKQKSIEIPKGTPLLLGLYFTQREERDWEDPNTFNPYRFLQDGEKNKSSLLAFSTGPNMCLGQAFARRLTKVLILTLIQESTWTSPNDHFKQIMKLTLSSDEDIYVNFKARSTKEEVIE
jgi:cytochrome P450